MKTVSVSRSTQKTILWYNKGSEKLLAAINHLKEMELKS